MIDEKMLKSKKVVGPSSARAMLRARRLIDTHWIPDHGTSVPIDSSCIAKGEGVEVIVCDMFSPMFLALAKITVEGEKLIFVHEKYPPELSATEDMIRNCAVAHALGHLVRREANGSLKDPCVETGKDYVYPQIPYEEARKRKELLKLERFAGTFTAFMMMPELIIDKRWKGRALKTLDPQDVANVFKVGEPAAREYLKGLAVLEDRAETHRTEQQEATPPQEFPELTFPVPVPNPSNSRGAGI